MKRALILINFVNDFFLPKGSMYLGPQVRKLIPFTISILDEFRKKKDVIVSISDAHQSEDRELKIQGKHSMRDSWGGQTIDELAILPGEYQITKRCYSGAFSTPMADVLKRNYVGEVHILGLYTSVDVMETAAALFYHGFDLVTYKKGIADPKTTDHSSALKRMQKLFNLKIV